MVVLARQQGWRASGDRDGDRVVLNSEVLDGDSDGEPDPHTTVIVGAPQLVEQALVDHYLGTLGKSGSGPLRYLDASGSELAVALDADTAEQGLQKLLAACGSPRNIQWVLHSGVPSGNETPGFLRYLILTCAVIASSGEAGGSEHEFGSTLARLLGCDDIFGRRQALPAMWRSLVRWCEQKRNEGHAIRAVSLPPPGVGVHLGYSNAVTFPNWRDASHLQRLVNRLGGGRAIGRISDAAGLVCPRVTRSQGFSGAMCQAAEEFRTAYQQGAGLLRHHRFWRTLEKLLRRGGSNKRPPSYPRLVLAFASSFDDVEARLELIDSDPESPRSSLDGQIDDLMARRGEWLTANGFGIERRTRASVIRNDLIPLVETTLGTWISLEARPSVRTSILVLVRLDARMPDTLSKQPRTVVGRQWGLIGPLSPDDAAGIFPEATWSEAPSDPSSESAFRLEGGLRSGGAYLGLPGIFPAIRVSARTFPRLIEENSGKEIPLGQHEVGLWRILSQGPLDGRYRLRIASRLSKEFEPLEEQASIHFLVSVAEHNSLSQWNPADWEVSSEIVMDAEASTPETWPPQGEPSSQAPPSPALNCLLESVYAGGRSGWSEAALLALVGQVIGKDGPSAWDVLRSLEEACWLQPARSLRWRARRWWLLPPRLVLVHSESGALVEVEGSTPHAVLERFRGVAAGLGLRVRQSNGVGPLSPPLWSCEIGTDANARQLAIALEWSLLDATSSGCRPAPRCWPVETLDHARHTLQAVWNLGTGRFVAVRPSGLQQTGLARYRQERGDRHDIFVLRGDGHALLTTVRNVAVLEAARRHSRAMFHERSPGLYSRMIPEGYLPLPFAISAARRSGVRSGPVQGTQGWTYAYRLDNQVVDRLNGCLGRSFLVRGAEASPQNEVRVPYHPSRIAASRARGIFRVNSAAGSDKENLLK